MTANSTAPATLKPNDEPPPHPGMGAVANQPTGRVQAPRVFERDERSQATQVEQARAIAEVQAAIYVAQERPRDMDRALAEMRKVCAIPAMAERAFFKFPRGKEVVTGASVHLARELARIWGNLTFGISELSRNDVRRESEMLAYAWDLQTNVRPSNSFIVPHARDTRHGVKQLVDMRDIYENNANMGARRLRECVFACLPKWFTDEAEDICRITLEQGGGVPIKERIDQMFNVANALGVTEEMIVRRIGKGIINITHSDLAELKITFRSIKNGEISKDDAFPDAPAADVTSHLRDKAAQNAATPSPKPTPAPTDTPPSDPPATSTADQEFANDFINRVSKCGSLKVLNELLAVHAERLNELDALEPVIYSQIKAVVAKRKEQFAK